MSLLGGRALSRPRLLDRYIVREMLAPTAIGLLVFTFVLLIDQIPRLLAVLVARSADFTTILRVFANLLPSILAITIPMAFLLGVLLAFGRLASDSEIIALRAVGVSPLRLLSPVLILASVMTAITFYINAVALPAANQAHREIVFSLVVSKARTDVKPRTFSEKVLPDRMMLYVQDIEPGSGRWKNLLIQDTRDIAESKLILARTGELVVDRERQIVRVELGAGSQHSFFGADPRAYNRTDFSTMGWDLPVDEFFPDRNKLLLAKGDREMTLPELAKRVEELRSQHKPRSDWGRYAVEWHKKFAIPAACLVFGLLGLALSLGNKKEARSAAFALSIGVIFVYYILIRLGEQAGDTGSLRPWLSMWGANIVLGTIAVALLYLNHREAAFDPFDPVHYLRFVPRIRRAEPVALEAGARRAPVRASVRPVVVLRIPRLRLRLASLLDRYIARAWLGNVALVMLAFAAVYFLADFMDLIDDFQQNRVSAAVIIHYYTFYLFQIAFTVAPDRGAGRSAGDARDPGAAQRDHRHEGGRHQHLPGRAARAGHGGRGQPAAVRRAGVGAAPHQQAGAAGPQRDQGPAGAVLGPVREALDAGERRPLLQLRLHRRARARPAPRPRRALPRRRVLGLRAVGLRHRSSGLAAARAPVRVARLLEQRARGVRSRPRLAAHHGRFAHASSPS